MNVTLRELGYRKANKREKMVSFEGNKEGVCLLKIVKINENIIYYIYIMTEYKFCSTSATNVMRLNQNIDKWLKENPGFEPYSNPTITILPGNSYRDETIQIIQPFIKYSNELNDKYLKLFLEELQDIPGTGTAFKAAQERFYRGPEAYGDLPEPPVKLSGGKTRRPKGRRSYKTRRSS